MVGNGRRGASKLAQAEVLGTNIFSYHSRKHVVTHLCIYKFTHSKNARVEIVGELNAQSHN